MCPGILEAMCQLSRGNCPSTLSHKALRLPAVVPVGRVKIVDAAVIGMLDDLPCLLFINDAILPRGQAHIAHAQSGKLQILKWFVLHCVSPFFPCYKKDTPWSSLHVKGFSHKGG